MPSEPRSRRVFGGSRTLRLVIGALLVVVGAPLAVLSWIEGTRYSGSTCPTSGVPCPNESFYAATYWPFFMVGVTLAVIGAACALILLKTAPRVSIGSPRSTQEGSVRAALR